jgi:flagellin-like protein
MLKRGVSPVIATVLLVVITIVLAGIVYIWARGFVQEGIEKNQQPIERSCENVKFTAGVYDSAGDLELQINNQGQIPFYGVTLKGISEGTVTVHEAYPDGGIAAGDSKSFALDASEYTGESDFLIVPIIIGKNKNGNKITFTCADGYGVDAQIQTQ